MRKKRKKNPVPKLEFRDYEKWKRKARAFGYTVRAEHTNHVTAGEKGYIVGDFWKYKQSAFNFGTLMKPLSRYPYMTNPPSRTYTYFQDPGHGWIAVKIDELQQLQIEQKISTYSYLKGKTAYLEEDSDAATWYQAYFAQWGEKPKFKEKHTNRSSPIRSYPRYYRVLT